MDKDMQPTLDKSTTQELKITKKHRSHIKSFYIGMRDREVSLTTTKESTNSDNMDSKLISYKCTRYDLWDIHLFIEQVLASDKPGFAIVTNKRGEKCIKQLTLGDISQ